MPPVLVAHSMGGYVIQKYLENHTAPAGILMASIPVRGLAGSALRYCRKHPVPFLKYMLSLDSLQMVATPDLMKDVLFSPTLPASDLARHFARLQPESYLVTEAEVIPNIAHDMMLEPEWQKVADRMLGWLTEHGL